MSATLATAAGIRLFAIWLGIYVLGDVAGVLSFPSPSGSNIPLATLYVVVGAIVALGLWVFAVAVPNILGDLMYIRLYSTDTDMTQVRRGLLYPFLQLLVATWLIFGAKGFRKRFWWARNAGYNSILESTAGELRLRTLHVAMVE
jgi:hypothetical protein